MSFNLYSKSTRRDFPTIQRNIAINDPNLYLPSQGLIDAVNVALTLGQPLLLTGEPGTGKTRLAHHIAWIFKLGKPLVFNAQTSSTVKDVFYKYDAIGHFQYSQTSAKVLSPEEVEQRFITYQGLGKAIKENKQFVVLMDEIDKAPRDLPNDILAALEDLTFSVTEIGKTYQASDSNKPIIVMTSNSEKNLPDAFLRRVVFYHIPFPDARQLLAILKGKISGLSKTNLSALVQHFEQIRAKDDLVKKPATAELIHWAVLLQKLGFDTNKLANMSKLSPTEKGQLEMSYSVLAKTREDLKLLKEGL
ncbi:MAG: MoxR family ATPase [Bacteroidota bacterium]